MKIPIFRFLFTLCLCFADAESVSCEKISDSDMDVDHGWGSQQKTCYMNGTTVIDSPGVSISSAADASVGALYFEDNTKIKFLPVNTAKSFSNLVVYDAGFCSIETITKENFKALSKLIKLYLSGNKLDRVPSDVFEDLIALEMLWLKWNKIKFINSAAFRGFSKLRDVDFTDNVCIQGTYKSATSVATMIPTLTDKCGFSEDLFLYDFSGKTSDQASNISESVTSNRKEQQEQKNTSNTAGSYLTLVITMTTLAIMFVNFYVNP